MKTDYNLSWGDPVIVRQALVETLGRKFSLSGNPLSEMGYPAHFGTPKLIEQLKDMAERQSGHRPKHLFATCGATGAIHAALYALNSPKLQFVITNKRFYPFYPSIIKMSGIAMLNWDNSNRFEWPHSSISLIDSPSNPDGLVYPFIDADIWDAAYASRTYTFGGHTPNKYRVMCGSLSKTLGLAGLRIGWASTDSDEIAKSLGNYVTGAYIGLSSVSMSIAEDVLSTLDQDGFETRSKDYLDDNRNEIQKVLNKFGQPSVSTRGMFAILELGKIEKKAIDKANVKYLPGSIWGETDDFARLSLGQTRETIKSAVKAILK